MSSASLCAGCAVLVCGLPVGSVKISWRMGKNRMVSVLWLLAQLPVVYEMHTSSSSCHTPAVNMISGWNTSSMSFAWSYVVLHRSC